MTEQEKNSVQVQSICDECTHPQSEHSEHDDWMCNHGWVVGVEGCQCSGYRVGEIDGD